ncbi:c-type cytochrome [Chitinophaga vietnamensis]|uniref:c-type cytochrome n=1 Tax=Chitinophaga vietnamensis TaxID=2593957 RepID=UPI001F01B0C2|nr:c-type cytochrome [Chitinophaga vietnamensis]
METNKDKKILRYKRTVFQLVVCLFMLVLVVLFETFFLCYRTLWADLCNSATATTSKTPPPVKLWQAPDEASIPAGPRGDSIRYGQALIRETARYLGPKGSVMQISNGMNCQNCHLNAGTKAYGNNYSAVASCYPKFRARSNSNESIIKRVSDCFERSLNGSAPDSNSREMQSIKAYMEWLGANVAKGEQPAGCGLKKLPLPARAASPDSGQIVYLTKCQSCHGARGEGKWQDNGIAYTYPPLWGEHSYNDAAGLYRLSNFAAYVKYNMPLGVDHNNPQLSDAEAWDVAAFINSQPRPHKDQSADWHDISKKPFDFPFGPYADNFSEKQHKYGPFQPLQH